MSQPRHSALRGLIAVLLTLAALGGSASAALGQEPDDDATQEGSADLAASTDPAVVFSNLDPAVIRRAADTGDLAVLVPSPAILHPDVAASARVDASAVRGVVGRIADARETQIEAVGRIDGAAAEVASLEVQLELVTASLREARAREWTASAVADQAGKDIITFAVEAYVEGSSPTLGDVSPFGEVDRFATVNEEVSDIMYDQLRTAVQNQDRAARATRLYQAGQTQLIDAVAEARTAGENAQETLAKASADIERLAPLIEPDLLTAPVVGLDFPLVVLDAYYRGADWAAKAYPSCGLAWYQISAIGRVESGHGTFGGTKVRADGVTEDRILGPALDGVRFASISDSDGGALDGDTTWDRAVGPMQFIPSSWRIFGQDGNGDGEKNPHSLYDAAAGAADHLCRSHTGLSAPENYRQALFGYNRSESYGTLVMGYADGYRSALTIAPGGSGSAATTNS